VERQGYGTLTAAPN